MPYVPLPFAQERPNAPDAPGGIARTPTADYSGIQAASAQLARASQLEDIPTDPFLAPGRGIAAIGGGMAQAGGILHRLQADKKKTDDSYDMAVAVNQLHATEAEFEKTRTKLDPRDLPDEWNSISDQSVNSIMENGKMSREARERFRLYAEQWKGKTRANILVDSIKETGQRAEDEVAANFYRSVSVKNIAGAENQLDAIQRGVDSGEMPYMSPLKLLKMREDLAAAKDEAKMGVLYDEADADPDAFIEKYPTRPEDMTPGQFSRIVSHAKEVRREYTMGDVHRFEDAIADGTIKTPEEVDEWEPNNERIRPSIRAAMKSTVFKRKDAMQQEIARANAPEFSSRLLSEIKRLDPETATEEQFIALNNRVKELPEGWKDFPYSRLMRKWRASEGDDEPEHQSIAFGEEILEETFDAGGFGAFTHTKEPILDAAGQQKMNANGEPMFRHEYNSKDYINALEAKTKAGGEYMRWLRKFPKASTEEIRAKLTEIVPASTRVSVADEYDKRPADPKPSAPAPKAKDKPDYQIPEYDPPPVADDNPDAPPSRGGPPKNLLIPFEPPLPE